MCEQEKKNLQQYADNISQILRPSCIKIFLTEYLDEETAEKILAEERTSVTSATKMLLDKMKSLEQPGWFQAFLDVLLAARYTGLHQAICEWNFSVLENLQPYRVLLEKIEPSITKHIKPIELLSHMSDCLTQRQCEEIRAVGQQSGNIAASERLVDCLKRSDQSNWFKVLKLALHNCELKIALELLDPCTDGEKQKPSAEPSDVNEEAMRAEAFTTVWFQYRDKGESDDVLESSNDPGLTDKPHGTSDAKEMAGGKSGERKLRAYQTELASAAYTGENAIICAPTGCGKTIVALAICENHLKKFPGKAKVVFMATKVDVYAQQLKLFEEHFKGDPDVRIAGVCGEMEYLDMRVTVEGCDVIVLTPQILVNALQRGEVPSLEVFSLLVFDECHNTTGKHPYNVIMGHYLDHKLNGHATELPQIVGLTASVGVGTFKKKAEAENNIGQLCANLDVRVIATVTKHLDDLRSFVHTPEKDFFEVEPHLSDPFIKIVTSIMTNIERMAAEVYNIESLSNIQNRAYGSQKYEQWIVAVQKQCKVLRLKDLEEEKRVCRALFNYTEHLRKYNDALIIHEDARMKDALDYLDAFFKQVRSAGFEDTERKLTNLYDVSREQLHSLTSVGQQNPKLETLKFILDEEYRNNDQTRTVLFVKTRALADALKKWIEETDSLKSLRPGVLIGRGRKSNVTGSGMTLTSQKGVLDSFKSTDQSKILIATSVADEGIDIPQCNLVLMYEYVGNVVKMMQVRGRGRAQGSKCLLISSQKERIAKEKLNMEREKIVEEAIMSLQSSAERLSSLVDVFQREDKVKRDLEKSYTERPRQLGSYELLCAKCKTSAFYSHDLRVLQESHHIVLDHSIFKRCITEAHPNPKGFDGFMKNEKMYCANCEHDWGIIASYMTVQDLPVVKIESFVAQDCTSGRQQCFRKWRAVPFAIKPFDLAEMTAERWVPRGQGP